MKITKNITFPVIEYSKIFLFLITWVYSKSAKAVNKIPENSKIAWAFLASIRNRLEYLVL